MTERSGPGSRGGLGGALRRLRGGTGGAANGGPANGRAGAARASRDEAVRAVLGAAEARGIEFLRLWFTDVLGFLKSFAIPAEELERAFAEGVTFDGSAIEGFARDREEDLVARPDPFTFQVLPWGEQAVGTMFCDIATPDGAPFPGDPRAVLRRVVERARSMGFALYVGPEIEFFLFRDESGTELLDHGAYFDVTTMDVSSDFRRRVIRALERLGIPVEESHHEVAASQHEIDLRYADALTTADSIMAFRLAVKEVAREIGVYATFMPKPIQGQWGSGMHLHLALFRDGRNAFADGEAGLSETGRLFVGGLLRHARAFTAVTNQWVNSYKRLVPGFEAPVYASWGRHSRSALVRVPPPKPGRPESTRVEIRSPDPACNPYLALAAILAAGLDGIATCAAPPGEVLDVAEWAADAERAAEGSRPLPASLAEAVGDLEASALMREVLGNFVLEWIVRNKRADWAAYRTHVSPFEVERYLAVL
ncbi:MAG: glutamine synthetase [Acidobacteria bacterium]|nr:glutamine synthetase [Acidobacteriota bacterium]